jgi:hypothetical protein
VMAGRLMGTMTDSGRTTPTQAPSAHILFPLLMPIVFYSLNPSPEYVSELRWSCV